MSEQTSFDVMIKITCSGELKNIFHLDAKDSEAADLLNHALDSILKRPGDEAEELAIRFKWVIAVIERAAAEYRLATAEAKLARLEYERLHP
jgi:hypothetical protein